MSSARKQIIAGNWKMNLTAQEAAKRLEKLDGLLGKSTIVEVFIAPPFTALTEAHKALRWSRVSLLGQNMNEHESGAYTGEISAEMLLTSGCVGTILGHSERRALFGEDNELIGRKVVRAFSSGLFPVICVGETESQREANETEAVLSAQLEGAFPAEADNEIGENGKDFAVAYEPVWAIGTGKVATPEIAQSAHQFIRGWLAKRFPPEIASRTRLLYGGSVKPENAEGLLKQQDIDGALVGGASLQPDVFYRIIEIAQSLSITMRA